jgi:hypothetical protein
MRRKVALLVLKDLYMNRYALLLSLVTLVLFILVLDFMKPFPSAELKMTLVVTVNLFMTVGYGDWLVSREKAKGTLITLRLLPVPDTVLVGSKFTVGLLVQTLVFVVSVVLLLPEYLSPPKLHSLVLIWLGLLSFGSLMLFTKTIFSQRIGQATPFMVLLGLMVGFLKISDAHPDGRSLLIEVITTPSGLVLVFLAATGFIVLTWLGSWLWLRARDSCQLID